MPKNSLLKFLIKLRNKGSINKPINFNSAKNIAIIYEVENSAEFKLIDSFIKKLNTEIQDVFSMEFLPKERDSQTFLKEVNHYFFKESDINFLKIPGKKITDKFCHRKFDIIVNMAKPENVYMHYLISICKAKFKISLNTENYSWLYNFLVDPGKESGVNHKINSIDRYLRIVNKN